MIENLNTKKNIMLVCIMISFTIIFGLYQSAIALNLKLGGTQTPAHPGTEGIKYLVEMVDEKTNGKIKIEPLLGGVLGGERELVEALQLGNIEMAAVSDIGMATVVSEVGFAYLPYLCTSYEEVEAKYYGGWIGEELKKRLLNKNIVLLSFSDNDFRWITNSKHPVLKPEDLKGMSIRVPEIPELIQFFRELGALPITMAVTEVVPALQQGAVDGQDNGAVLNYTFGFHEFQPYMTMTNHVFSGGGILINKSIYDKLNSKEQEILRSAAIKASAMSNEKLRSERAGYTKKMRDAGAQIDEVTPELEKAMKEAAQKVWENPRNIRRYGEEVMTKIIAQ